ncbi:MAG TPA: ArsA-related P-loop ATPase [Acidimicrobiales bacterium]|nr:ArsA-related P-loop ATPase [Acidimicrobiales bacterium]
MDVATFCTESRVLVVAGKGGVGKTTIAAALARMAADAGLSVLVVELEGRAGLSTAFGGAGPLAYEDTVLLSGAGVSPDGRGHTGTVRGRWLTPDDALLEYLADHGLERVSKRLLSSGLLDVVSTAIPGIRDVLVLGKVKQLERERVADLIVVDAPATGHAVTFLTSASGLLDAARGGPVRAQAADVVELLTDPSRCRVLLVTLPEEMPVSETVEAAYVLEDRAGVKLGPVVVNAYDAVPAALGTSAEKAAAAAGVILDAGQLAALEEARTFRLHRHDLAAEQIGRLARELPLPQLFTPPLAGETVGPPELAELAAALAEGVNELTSAA